MTNINTFREEKRQEALEAKSLIQRTSGGFYTTSHGINGSNPLVFLDEGDLKLLTTSSLVSLNRQLAREKVEEFFTVIDPNSSLIFADRSAFHEFKNMAGGNTAPYGEQNTYYAPYSTMLILASLKFTRGMQILTDVLNHRWWLPAGMDKNSIQSWIGAPTVSGATLPAKLLSLEQMTRENDELASVGVRKNFTSLIRTEASIASSSTYTGSYSDIGRMRDVQSHGAKTTRIARNSPGVQLELSLSGEMTRAEVMWISNSEFGVRALGATKLVSEKIVNFHNSHGLQIGASRRVLKVEALDSGINIVINGGAGRPMLGSGSEVYLAESPFLPRFTEIANKRWISKKPYSGPEPMYIPMDILAAQQ